MAMKTLKERPLSRDLPQLPAARLLVASAKVRRHLRQRSVTGFAYQLMSASLRKRPNFCVAAK